MSYTKELKLQLLHTNAKKCCGLSELEALMRTGGELVLGAGGAGITFSTELEPLAGRVVGLFRELLGADPRMLMLKKSQPRRMVVYQAELDGAAAVAAFEKFGYSKGVLSAPVLPRRECCMRAALRGAFLGCGMLADPNKQYLMEFSAAGEMSARYIRLLLDALNIVYGESPRGDRNIFYIKEAQGISRLLGLMGASALMLEVENVRVVREVRNRINRQNNCESANMDKSISAALKTAEDMELILESGYALSDVLYEAAEARANRPDASLAALAAELGISRSALNNRLRRLHEIAEEIRAGQ